VLRETESEEVTGKWRKLHNDSFMICYSSPNITRADQIKEEPMGGDKEMVVWQRHGKQRSEGRL
jgi:hypothetical protein